MYSSDSGDGNKKRGKRSNLAAMKRLKDRQESRKMRDGLEESGLRHSPSSERG